MGVLSTTKFIKNVAGALTEEAMLTTSAGAVDAQKSPALNASGVLDLSIVNGKASSAGAGDAAKLVALDAAGRIHITMMPIGLGADTATVGVSSDNLVAGNLVNIYNNVGVATVRKADATLAGKEAHGFVIASTSTPNAAVVYFEGTISGLTGLTPGVQFLSTTPGGSSATAPGAPGNTVQRVGFATSATSLNFQSATPITLA